MSTHDMRDNEWHDDLVKMHQARILALLTRRLGTRQAHVAHDLAQRTFLTAWEKRAEVPHEPGAWLARTALYHLRNHWRWWRPRSHEPPAHDGGAGEPAQDNCAARAKVIDVDRALHQLSKSDRGLLCLAYMDDYSGAEIAEILGITPAAVRQRLSRAARRMRAILGPGYLHDDHGDGEARS